MPFNPPFWSPSQASAILFDWDGIIAETRLDFSEIRNRYYGGRRAMLLEDACTLPEEARTSLMSDLEELEIAGALSAEPVDGIHDVLEWVAGGEIPWAIVSRNCKKSILAAAERIEIGLPPIVRSRDDGDCVKPDPRALTETAQELGVAPAQTLFIGDFIYDMMGARRAGMRGVLVRKNIEAGWQPWLECAYADMRGLAEELRSPSEVVPWEYQETARAKGRGFLSFTAGLTLALPERTIPNLDGWLTQAAMLGVGRFLIPDEIFTPNAWKANPSFDPANMGLAFETAVRDFLRTRYPLATVLSPKEMPKAGETVADAPFHAGDLSDFLTHLFERRKRELS